MTYFLHGDLICHIPSSKNTSCFTVIYEVFQYFLNIQLLKLLFSKQLCDMNIQLLASTALKITLRLFDFQIAI